MKKTILMSATALMMLAATQQSYAQWTRDAGTFQTYLTNTGDNVGIGTTNPIYKLDVRNAGIATMQFKSNTENANILLDKGATNKVASLNYRTAGATNWQTGCVQTSDYSIRNFNLGTVAMFFDYATNNVGIGTTTPHAPLQFTNALVNRKVVLYENTNNDHQFYGFGVNGASLRYQVDATGANHIFYAGTSPTTSNELMRIMGTGNVGIGTSSPAALLDVVSSSASGTSVALRNTGTGNVGFELRSNGAATQFIDFQDGATGTQTPDYRNRIASTNSSLSFSTNTLANAMVILNAGNVGIGTATPAYKLDVNGDASVNGVRVGRGNSNLATNTALGNEALLSNTSGEENTANGHRALLNNTVGYYNSAFGWEAQYHNINGDHNTAIGSTALFYNESGSWNTAIGILALGNNTTGSYNTGIGAYTNVSSNLNNATALGYSAVATADNQVMLGNTSVISVKAAGSFVIYSDGRFKKNIKENVPGLDFINQLKPVTYNYDINGLNNLIGIKNADLQSEKINKEAIANKEKIVYTGFIAQDVEKAAQNSGYDFSGVYKPQNDKDPYGLSYADFVVPVVKAVQELDAKNKKVEDENAELKSKNQLLENRLNDLQQCLESLCNTNSESKISNPEPQTSNYLFQNQPNPFSQSTVIGYLLLSDSKNASIVIRNLNGELLKTVALDRTGKGQITINANELSQGTYTYTLIVNNQSVDTKLMVITK